MTRIQVPLIPNDIVIGCTGTRNGLTIGQRNTMFLCLPCHAGDDTNKYEFHHGDDKGADKDMAYIARSYGYWIVGHPPSNPYRRYYFDSDENREPLPFLDRNRKIVAESGILFACPEQNSLEEERYVGSGTWATIRYARKKGIPILYLWPSGDFTYKETHD